MTYFRDLMPCDYGSFSTLKHLVAIGWLEPPFDFPRGTVKRAMRARLEALFIAPWSPIVFMGSHACPFCVQAAGVDPVRADLREDLPRGSANILIPGRDVVYVSPHLILHYIDEHQYCPPPAFARAVGVCPPIGSRGYFLALMAAGGDMPAFLEGSSDGAVRQAASVWRNPLRRAWHRTVRSLATGPRVLREPLLNEWAAARETRKAREFPRQRVADFLVRVSNAGYTVHEHGDEFVLPHPDGEIRVCPIDVRWVVRRKRGNIWWPHGAAANEAELEQLLSSAIGGPIP